MLNATQSYRQAQVNTVGRADITLMLFDGLLRFLDLAAEKMEEKKVQEKGNYISRALDIINELDSTLNMEKGGEVSKGLHQLYLLTNKNLLMANLKNDMDILKSARNNMQVVRDAFFEAMQTEEAKAMLLKMGPVPMATNGNVQLNLGGSIQERSNQIKEAQQKVEAIKRAKAQFENAKTEEEKLLAQKELEALLGKKTLEIQSKPIPVSMAQKASRAFLQQQGFVRPQSAAGMQLKSHGQILGQGTAQIPQAAQNESGQVQNAQSAQVQAQPVNPLFRQSALLGQKAMQNMYAVKSEQTAPLQNAVSVPHADDMAKAANDTETEEKAAVSKTLLHAAGGQTGGLLSKKMALYKNM